MVFIPTYFGVRKILRLKINLPARTLGKLEKDDKVDFRSQDERQMKKYNDGLSWYQCCYKFVTQSDIPGHEHDQLSYTKCKEFKNGTIIMIEQEVITVTCYDKKHFVMYTDAYIVVKINYSSPKTDITKSWNVFMIGIDSMSRTRFFDTMPRTSAFIKKEKWLDYKGYHMVHPETSKTLLSILTGRNMSLSSCATSLSDCVDNFIWQKYKDAGYKTAFGETNLGISNTLSRGDHGNMFGKMQLPVGSYYNNRLPMLFIWVPLQFRRENLNIHFNLRENQERLVSPYDLYVTLADILELSTSAGAKTLSLRPDLR
nr:uncharacterized protein LOC110371532 [Helicoverpa armigera]